MFIKEEEVNLIVTTINRYRKFYVKNNLLPELYCTKNDGTHLPLTIRVEPDDSVYLYCLTCDFEKQAGLVTVDNLLRYMRWRDLHPSETLLTQ
jgi:hypothetical protein